MSGTSLAQRHGVFLSEPHVKVLGRAGAVQLLEQSITNGCLRPQTILHSPEARVWDQGVGGAHCLHTLFWPLVAHGLQLVTTSTADSTFCFSWGLFSLLEGCSSLDLRSPGSGRWPHLRVLMT